MTRGGAAKNSPAPAIERLGIAPHIWGTECASGLGSDDNDIAGTSFPQPLGLAASFDVELARAVANITSTEVRAQHNADSKAGVVAYHHGINCWSPVINIMRHWSWGRNDETYGECPVLTSAITSEFVGGLQGTHPRFVAVTAGCKHMGVHGGPDATRRTFDANVTLRDWSTTFLSPFEACVSAGGLGIMCSFNAVRGVPACANSRSMRTWAKQQFGFPGYIVSDQGAAYGVWHDHAYARNASEAAALAVRAGLDLEDADSAEETVLSSIPAAVATGALSEKEHVDPAVSRLFYVRMRTGEFDPPINNPYRLIDPAVIRSPAHLQVARQAAVKSLVLLQNRNHTLPLVWRGKGGGNHDVEGKPVSEQPEQQERQGQPGQPGQPWQKEQSQRQQRRVVVVGPFGNCTSCYFGKYSPRAEFGATISVLEALRSKKQGFENVLFAQGCTDGPACQQYDAGSVREAIAGGNSDTVNKNNKNNSKGFSTPSGGGSTVIVLAVGLGFQFESEGKDRPNMRLPGHQPDLVDDVHSIAESRGDAVVSLLFVAGPVDPAPFDRSSAVLDCFYPGEMAGPAVVDVLLGIANPAGRLPFSWPNTESDVLPEQDYTMVGRTYRYGQRNVHWAFGHGLSYTQFRYSQPRLSASRIAPLDVVRVDFDIVNTGSVSGDAVPQLYLRWKAMSPPLPTPTLSLANFTRVHVETASFSSTAPGSNKSSVHVSLSVEPRQMAVLTSPRCGIKSERNTALGGAPWKLVEADTAAECCSACASYEMCEAYTWRSAAAAASIAGGGGGGGKQCTLFTAWARAHDEPNAVSGEPLPQWVVRPGVIEVALGAASDALGPWQAVEITGSGDTPLPIGLRP